MQDKIPLTSIDRDPRLQLRVKGLDKHHVAELVDALKAGKKLGAIKACRHGKKVFVYDGWHRVAAHEAEGEPEIDATLQDGDIEQAILLAASANSTHGLKRSNEDKRAAISSVLSHPQAAEWSDGKIADYVGVTQQFVSKVRDELTTVVSCGDESEENNVPVTRVGKDGKRRKVAKKKSRKPQNISTASSDVSTDHSNAAADSQDSGSAAATSASDPLDSARSAFRSIASRLDAKHTELNALAEEMGKFSGAGFEKLNGTQSITSRIGDAARSCKSAAANLRNATPHESAECTTCKGRGHACKDCGGMGWQSNEERRDADNRRKANSPRSVPA